MSNQTCPEPQGEPIAFLPFTFECFLCEEMGAWGQDGPFSTVATVIYDNCDTFYAHKDGAFVCRACIDKAQRDPVGQGHTIEGADRFGTQFLAVVRPSDKYTEREVR